MKRHVIFFYSKETKETVVLHAANEDEVDDVLVVNEEHGDDNIDNNKYKPVTSILTPQVTQGQAQNHMPIMQSNSNDLRQS